VRDILFVSYYTPEAKYEQYAVRLIESFEKFSLPYTVHRLPEFDSWAAGIRHKPQFILETLLRRRCPIVWVDVDAVILKRPELLFGDHDFAVYNWCADTRHHLEGKIVHSDRVLSASGGVMKFGYTPGAIELLLRWVSGLTAEPESLDDPMLSRVFNEWQPPVNSLWLPKEYNRMDLLWPAFPADQIIIDHQCRCGGHKDEVEGPGEEGLSKEGGQV